MCGQGTSIASSEERRGAHVANAYAPDRVGDAEGAVVGLRRVLQGGGGRKRSRLRRSCRAASGMLAGFLDLPCRTAFDIYLFICLRRGAASDPACVEQWDML